MGSVNAMLLHRCKLMTTSGFSWRAIINTKKKAWLMAAFSFMSHADGLLEHLFHAKLHCEPALLSLQTCRPHLHKRGMTQLMSSKTSAASILIRVCRAVARIALVKPEKARGVESMILQMAQKGALTERVRFVG